MLAPSLKRKYKKNNTKLNIVPILDIVFILIFFLLTSSHFIKIFSIGSDIPIFSDKNEIKNDVHPLNLKIKIESDLIKVYTGEPSTLKKEIRINSDKNHGLKDLNEFLTNLKKDHPTEDTCLLEPNFNIPHQLIVNVMDSVRESVHEQERTTLFNKLIFGNL